MKKTFKEFWESGEVREYLAPRGICEYCDEVYDALNAVDADTLETDPNYIDAYHHAMAAFNCYTEGLTPTTDDTETKSHNSDLRDKQLREAKTRLQMLGCESSVMRDFVASGKLYYSERTRLGGILYWISNHPEWESLIRTFEEDHNAVVYHATHEHTEFGELLDLLYVSQYCEEWDDDKDELKDLDNGEAYVYAYVLNLTDPDCSELGSIGITRKNGGIIRTA